MTTVGIFEAKNRLSDTADADVNAALNIRDRARGLWGDAGKVEVAHSLDLLLAQQAKPKRSFKKKSPETTGGSAQACSKRGGFLHAQGRKRSAATRTAPLRNSARSFKDRSRLRLQPAVFSVRRRSVQIRRRAAALLELLAAAAGT